MTGDLKDNFFLDDWRVSPTEGIIARGQEVVHLEPKAMEVLAYLASRPGEVVTREDLERDIWRGALVSYDAVTNTIIKLRKALGDEARNPRFIATIPKKGYQLIMPVHQFGPDKQPDLVVTPGSPQAIHGFQRYRLQVIGAVIVVLIAVAWVLGTGKEPGKRDGPPLIAVLPFENLNNDPRQDYLADGVTEDLITDLSKLSNIRVISSNTSSAFRGEQASIRQIGDELGVAYVVKGNIRRLKESFRVNVQLVNTGTGFNAWATRYDRKLDELFAVQDDVTRNIVRALSVDVSKKEETRLARKATNSLEAYDYFQEGLRNFRYISKETNKLARQSYRKAIELDPNYGRAYGAIAVTLAYDYRWGWTDTPVLDLDRALELATKAVELDPASPQTYWALGFVELARKNFANAKRAALQSLQVAPNYADGHGLLGLISVRAGDPNTGIKYTLRGMELNPYYSWEYLYLLGQAYYQLRDFDKAIGVLEEAQARNSAAIQTKVFLAASYVRVGRQDDAEWIIEQMQFISPSTSLSTIERTLSLGDTDTKKSLMADLEQAGLPD